MFLQDPYWNKITCTDAFQWKTYCFQEIVILKQQNAKSVTDASIWVMIISKNSNTLGKEHGLLSSSIGRPSLVFILHDVTRFTPLLARLVQ